MSAPVTIGRKRGRLHWFARDEAGTSLVEFAIVLVVFLLLFTGLIDFGRMAFHLVSAEKATQIAARIAAVRPPACATALPEFHDRPVNGTADYGMPCRAGADVCAAVSVTCLGDPSNPTVYEIWTRVGGVLPNDATMANLRFHYDSDPNLGFLGGPFVPVVTVEIEDLYFRFFSALGALVSLGGGTPSPGLGSPVRFPRMSVSLPAEDLALGNSG